MTAIVTGLWEKSGSLLVEEVWPELKSFLFFQKELRKLESTLRNIQEVLEEADRRQVNDGAVKLWLDKLKEAAYDMDNVLDELETAIIKAKIEEEEEKAETTTATAKGSYKAAPFPVGIYCRSSSLFTSTGSDAILRISL